MVVDTRLGRTAAEIYHVQPYYQRFNQKNNMTRQPLWNPKVAGRDRERMQHLSKLVESDRAGYRLEDWASYVGGWANMVSTGFSINWPNQRGNSWQPLSKGDLLTLGPNAGINGPRPRLNYSRIETDPARTSRIIEKAARQFGADDVGVCLLDRKWVYSHWFDEKTKRDYPIRFSDEPGYETYTEPTQLENGTQVIPKAMRYAIVLIHEMDEKGIATAPTLTQSATVITTYSRISFTTIMLAEFIRGLGHHAIPSANDTALSIPLAIDASLGELGRNAKLVHPKFGPRCRISKVLTDLPLVANQPKMWGVTEFCNVCRKCARHCPAGAIPTGERSFEPVGDFSHRGVLQWQMDHNKCHEYLAKIGTGCAICLRTCPFNKSKHRAHDVARWFIRRGNRQIDSIMTRMDDILGYGKFMNPDAFWDT